MATPNLVSDSLNHFFFVSNFNETKKTQSLCKRLYKQKFLWAFLQQNLYCFQVLSGQTKLLQGPLSALFCENINQKHKEIHIHFKGGKGEHFEW